MRFLTVWCQRSILPWIIGWYPFDRSRCAKRTETHSARRLAARITFPHFCVSLAISLAKSAGAPGGTMNPRSANRALILGLARAALISLLSLSTISAGVPWGRRCLAKVVARHEFAHSRYVRQRLQTGRGRHGQPTVSTLVFERSR